MMKNGLLILSISILFLVAFAKAPPKSQQTLMAEYIQEKLEKSEQTQWIKCRENTIKDAVAFVDSIIYSQNDLIDLDSIKTPSKPIKPSKPFDTLKLDTRPIVPMLIEKKGVDSLNED